MMTKELALENSKRVTSIGHKMFVNGYEYFIGIDNCLYYAPQHNAMTIQGYRNGARFCCGVSLVERTIDRLNKIGDNGQQFF